MVRGGGFRMGSYVYISETYWNCGVRGRVAQVVAKHPSQEFEYTVIVNYNGQKVKLDAQDLRKATDAEKRRDGKGQ